MPSMSKGRRLEGHPELGTILYRVEIDQDPEPKGWYRLSEYEFLGSYRNGSAATVEVARSDVPRHVPRRIPAKEFGPFHTTGVAAIAHHLATLRADIRRARKQIGRAIEQIDDLRRLPGAEEVL